MSNIVELKTRTKILSQDTIELLEEWLEKAKNGEIISVALAAQTDTNSSISQWSETDHVQVLLSAITILEHRLLNAVIEE